MLPEGRLGGKRLGLPLALPITAAAQFKASLQFGPPSSAFKISKTAVKTACEIPLGAAGGGRGDAVSVFIEGEQTPFRLAVDFLNVPGSGRLLSTLGGCSTVDTTPKSFAVASMLLDLPLAPSQSSTSAVYDALLASMTLRMVSESRSNVAAASTHSAELICLATDMRSTRSRLTGSLRSVMPAKYNWGWSSDDDPLLQLMVLLPAASTETLFRGSAVQGRDEIDY